MIIIMIIIIIAINYHNFGYVCICGMIGSRDRVLFGQVHSDGDRFVRLLLQLHRRQTTAVLPVYRRGCRRKISHCASVGLMRLTVISRLDAHVRNPVTYRHRVAILHVLVHMEAHEAHRTRCGADGGQPTV